MPPVRMSNAQAVRAQLGAQGFGDPRPGGSVDVRHFRRMIRRIALLQIDSVNVLTRSHYLPVFARLGPYDRGRLDRFIYDGPEMFEYWSHEQAYTPIGLHSATRFKMAASEGRGWKRIAEIERDHPGYIDAVLDEVGERGPISSRLLDDPGERTGPWWGYGKGKIALEWLFTIGKVAVAKRANFERFYDLPERVIPPEVLAQQTLDPASAHRVRVSAAVKALGVGTVKDVADYFRMKVTETAEALDALVDTGEATRVDVSEWGRPAYADPELVIPRTISGIALLSPFDPVVWDRARAERMYGFHYRIEIYTPEPKRVFGYYVLPILFDGQLVGRVDLKADRQAGVLRAKGAFAEPGVDRKALAPVLATELESMAGWLGLGEVEVGNNGDLADPLVRSL
ncbi:MAG TPA: winged helix-turn-helix domain-containing protein [Actinobacteria bacterium]|nr:winged helix-turn-helix domain-containing protein [Actinomycetota bacterium]